MTEVDKSCLSSAVPILVCAIYTGNILRHKNISCADKKINPQLIMFSFGNLSGKLVRLLPRDQHY